MTSAVYDGKILAVDSRTTHSTNSSDHICTSCGEETEVVSEKAEKLHLSTDMTFRGKRVLAAAGAGMVAAIHDLIKMLKADADLETAFKHFRMFEASRQIPATLLLVTDDAVYTVNGRADKELKVKEYKRTDFVAIGSGSDAATAAHKLCGHNAIECINIAAAIDDGTGGRIHWVDCSAPIPKKPNFQIPIDPKKAIEHFKRPAPVPAPVVPKSKLAARKAVAKRIPTTK